MEKMSFEQMVTAMANMDNGDRIDFLEHLYHNHFRINPLTDEEMKIIDDLRDGYVKVVEADEL